jgi:hypothetical protein
LAIVVSYSISYIYRRYGSITADIQKKGLTIFVILANILSLYAITTQIIFYHNAKAVTASVQYQKEIKENTTFGNGYDTTGLGNEISNKYYTEVRSIKNRSNMFVSIFWAFYAAILTAIGFGKRMSAPRRLGLFVFIITAIKVVFDVWSLGPVYRIVSLIVFGVVALLTSFAYAKYKNRLKEII